MEESVAAWEDEGGSPARSVQIAMTGTVNQIGWADQIKIQVDAEFDRVRAALESQLLRAEGSKFIRERVFDKILEAENETQSPAAKQ